MTARAPFPDIEAALVTLFEDLASTGTVTPPNLQSELPFIRIAAFAGDDDRITDSSLVSIDCFAATRAVSHDLAESVRQRLLALSPNVVGTVTIDMSSTVTRPNEIPWSDDQTIRRFSATYRVSARR